MGAQHPHVAEWRESRLDAGQKADLAQRSAAAFVAPQARPVGLPPLFHVKLTGPGADVRWLAVDVFGNLRRLATRAEDAVALPRGGAEIFMRRLATSMAGREWSAELVPQAPAAI